MNFENAKEALNFAIEREKEAVSFYQDLQEKAKFTAHKQMLKELEDMEKGHIEILQSILSKGVEDIEEKKVKNLKISDYIVKPEEEQVTSYQDILIIAMKREEHSKKLYEDIAGGVSDAKLKKVFLRLSSEEAEHKLKFEKLYDEMILKEN